MHPMIFRGKSVLDDSWVIGDGIHYPKSANWKGTCWIDGMREKANDWVQVDPSSVGQYIGSNDKDDKCIFEGDIVHILHGNTIKRVFYPDGCITVGQIIYHDDGFMIRRKDHALMSLPPRHRIVVVGNIHDNPELIEG